MQWEGNTKPKKNVQTSLLLDLIDEEKLILNLLTEHKSLHYDELLNNLAFNPSLLSNYLLQLELKGIVSTLPGKNYTLT
jgi:DNA processing protein